MGLFDFFKKKSRKEDTRAGLDDNINEEDEEDEEDDDESLSVYDAADIWASNGKDEDYTFGYSEEELENALK